MLLRELPSALGHLKSSPAQRSAGRRLAVLTVLLSLCAFAIVWHFGHRGLMPLDHSINLDGGYRVLLGQVMYRDFFAAYLPGTLWLQALFFKLFGVSFTSMVIPAAVFNALGVLLVARIVWLVAPGRVLAPVVAALGTAVWFQAPFASLQHEQAGFFFCLAGLWMLAEAPGLRACRTAAFLAGLLLFAAILCKQNAGILFTPIALAFVIAREPRRRESWALGASALAGIVLGALLFIGWVCAWSDWDRFVTHAIRIPSSFGLSRALGYKTHFLGALTLQNLVFPASLLSLFSLVTAGLVLPLTWQRGPTLPGAAALLAVALHLFQSIFRLTALNQPENALPFLGLSFGLSLALLQTHFEGRVLSISTGAAQRTIPSRYISAAIRGTAALLGILMLGYGWRIVSLRTVHEFKIGTDFSQPLQIPTARLQWGEPTQINAAAVMARQDLESVYRYLVERPGNFLVLPETTILYGLTGRVPPQPLLFFLRNHSFRTQDIPDLDRRIVESLHANNVRTLVRERACFMEDCLTITEQFPRLTAWMAGFRHTRDFGHFQVYEKPQD